MQFSSGLRLATAAEGAEWRECRLASSIWQLPSKAAAGQVMQVNKAQVCMTWRLAKPHTHFHIQMHLCSSLHLSFSLYFALFLSLFHLFYSVLPCSVSYDAISDAANMRDDYRYVASFPVPYPASSSSFLFMQE